MASVFGRRRGWVCAAAAGLVVLAATRSDAQDAAACLECHALPDQSVAFKNGQTRSATLDGARFAASVHGAAGLDCTACHTDHAEYPHPEIKEPGPREYALARIEACASCHEEQSRTYADGVHRVLRAAGNLRAAACTDCHDPHAGKRLTDPQGRGLLPEARLEVPRTCAQCHAEVYDQYQTSAHGAALTQERNADVPTCIDCHGVHRIEDPRTARFRLSSPRLCASCHTDKAKMAKYGLSTAVLETYVADFHGSTVTLFEKQHPDQATNKPVCYDCHGVHDIPHTADPAKGLKVKANLLRTCQQCHPSATQTFPDAWMSHYIPDRKRAPLVFWTGWLYRILIPGTIGGMLLFVATDYARRVVDRRRGTRPPEAANRTSGSGTSVEGGGSGPGTDDTP